MSTAEIEYPDFLETPSIEVVHRSTLELCANCPRSAKLEMEKLVITSSACMDSGNEVHRMFSEQTSTYININDSEYRAASIVEDAREELYTSRPDVQPDAVDGAKFALWSWANFLSNLSTKAILRYDGGEGDRSGQLANDFTHLNLRATSEIDLLYAGDSKELLHEVDYKSGHKFWTVGDVKSSFQFQMHAWLILHNYPDAQAVEVTIWNTRINSRTYPVIFDRRDLNQWERRILSAAEIYRRISRREWQDCPIWPSLEKCSQCSGASMCGPAIQISEPSSDPETYLKETIALEQSLKQRKKILSGIVDSRGFDIVTADGDCYGTDKPKKDRKPSKAIYAVKGLDGEEESE